MNNITKQTCYRAVYEGTSLSHHGVLGMKWGIRRYQPYGEGGYNPEHQGKFIGKEPQTKHDYRKALNKTQEYSNRATVSKNLVDADIKKLSSKMEKATKKGNTSKAAQYNEKIQKKTQERDTYAREAKAAKQEIDSLLKSAEKSGFKVEDVKVNKYYKNQGKSFAKSALMKAATIPIRLVYRGPLVLVSRSKADPARSVESHQYFVYDKKN